MYKFERLRVYEDSLSLVEEIYKLTKLIPKTETFALVDQIKRASTSIVLNIAEGSGSDSDKGFKNFLRIALKSLYETVACLKLVNRLFKINTEIYLQKCELVGRELNGLIKSLSKSNS